MSLEVAVSYDGRVVASGRLGPEASRVELDIPPLPSEETAGALTVTSVGEPNLETGTGSVISEWLRNGKAETSADRLTVPLIFTSGAVFGARNRPFESTVYVTAGARLLRVILRIPTLVAAAPPTGPTAVEMPAAPPPPLEPPVTPAPRPLVTHPTAPLPPWAAEPPAAYRGPAATHASGFASPAPPPLPGVPSAAGDPAAGPGAGQVVCRNHPHVPTSITCAWCHNPFCTQCLVDFQGTLLCGWCKQASLMHLQRGQFGANVDPKQVVLWARVYNITMCLAGLASIGFIMWLQSLISTMPGGAAGLYGARDWTNVLPGIGGIVMALPPAIGIGPNRRWAYIWQMVMLIPSALFSCLWASCFGLGFWPAAIALLVYWIRPEVKAYCEGTGP